MATSNFIKQKYFDLYANNFDYKEYCFDETKDFLDTYNTEKLEFLKLASLVNF